ncbi:class B sortase [Lysinibacillus sp. NPDC097195]|uniref:class B sortase n=1 Tax=Lysinibacillus sp. NPDC097195 TaxID=3364141 RepID=UPI0038112FBE
MKKWTSKLLTVFYIGIFLYSGFALVKYLYTYYEAAQSLKEVQTIYAETLATIENEEVEHEEILTDDIKANYTIRPQFQDLLAVNQRIVGWISIDDTKLNNPILQADNNDFYLTHNFKNRASRAGSVFMDYRNDALDISRNTILYGHAMKDGTMFGTLKKYLDQDYANTHRTIYVDTLYEGYDVEIFAAYETTIDFYYIETEFKTDEEFMHFIGEVEKRSTINMNVDIGPQDKIITLSTCKDSVISDDHRFVVQGKLVKRK